MIPTTITCDAVVNSSTARITPQATDVVLSCNNADVLEDLVSILQSGPISITRLTHVDEEEYARAFIKQSRLALDIYTNALNQPGITVEERHECANDYQERILYLQNAFFKRVEAIDNSLPY